ncbi:MAG: hypothetical protein ACT6T0_05620 [Nevskia sp.]|uniref:hypothetical protein n=1 Tax=Nevskia sp. TaxID=1929292 RepID=UPI0040356138
MQPLAVSGLTVAAVFIAWYQLTTAGFLRLPAAAEPVAIETIAEVWFLSSLPALGLASSRKARPATLLASAILPALLLQCALFVLGSLVVTQEELERNVGIAQFVGIATAATGGLATCVVLFLKAAQGQPITSTNDA